MRVGIRSRMLGPVELPATLRDGGLGATIGVETPRAEALLTAELLALERTLAQHNLRPDEITIIQGRLDMDTTSSSASGSGSHAFSRPPSPHARVPFTVTEDTTPDRQLEGWEPEDEGARLSVHA